MTREIDDLSGELRVFITRLASDVRKLAQATTREQMRSAGLELAEAAHIQRALFACDGNKSQAARLLQIDRRSLQRKLGRLKKSKPKAVKKKRR